MSFVLRHVDYRLWAPNYPSIASVKVVTLWGDNNWVYLAIVNSLFAYAGFPANQKIWPLRDMLEWIINSQFLAFINEGSQLIYGSFCWKRLWPVLNYFLGLLCVFQLLVKLEVIVLAIINNVGITIHVAHRRIAFDLTEIYMVVTAFLQEELRGAPQWGPERSLLLRYSLVYI